MKNIFLILSVLVFQNGYAQRIIKNADDLNSALRDSTIKNVHRSLSEKYVVVKYKNKHKDKIESRSVWGFESKQKQLYRYYNKEFYEVVNIDQIMVYCTNGKSRKYFFSVNSNSPLEKLKLKNLIKFYGENHCFIEKLKNEKNYKIECNKKNIINRILKSCQ